MHTNRCVSQQSITTSFAAHNSRVVAQHSTGQTYPKPVPRSRALAGAAMSTCNQRFLDKKSSEMWLPMNWPAHDDWALELCDIHTPTRANTHADTSECGAI